MKKKIVLIILACLFIIPVNINAKGKEYTVTSVYDSTNPDLGGKKNNNMLGGAYDYQGGGSASITVDGKQAYCTDPGKKPVNTGATCTKETITGEQAAAYAYVFSNSNDPDVIGLSVRLLSTANGTATFGNTETEDGVNNRCAYVNAAAQVIKGSGGEVSDSLKNKTSSSGKVNCVDGYNVSGTKDSEGNSKGQTAINLATEAMKASSGTTISSGKIGKVTNKNGQVTIPYSDMPEGSKINITCTGGTCTGNIGENDVEGSGSLTISIDKTQCGNVKYSASVTMPGNANSCSKIVKYNCSAKAGSQAQTYIGCDETSDGDGNTTQKIADNELIKCNANDECNANPEASGPEDLGGADGLCNKYGETFIQVYEEKNYTVSDTYIDQCVIDENDINGKSLEATSEIMNGSNDYCKIYCTENYEFLSPGGLSSDDYNGDWLITSGSYFNFANKEATDKTEISCYGENHLDKLMMNIENLANNYANSIAESETKCEERSETDSDGNTVVKHYQKNISTTYDVTNEYASSRKLSIKIEKNVSDSGWLEVDSCTPSSNKKSDSEKQALANDYKSKSDTEIKKFEECNSWNFDKLKTQFADDNCNAKVEFNYTDGMWLDVTPVKLTRTQISSSETGLKKYKSSTDGKFESTSAGGSTVSVNLGNGVGMSNNQLTNATHTSNSITIVNEFTLDSVGICNNYNTGNSTIVPDKSACTGDGTTYVEGWPVSYETTQGEYHYEFIVSNYGHDFSGTTCSGGRLESVAGSLGMTESELVCPYHVNGCDDCDWGCDPNGICEGDDDCDEDCIWECKEVGCLFDISSGLAINYTPISLINLFNEESISYLNDQHKNAIAIATNKDKNNDSTVAVASGTKEGIANNWNNSKGDFTKTRISNLGETIYKENLEYKIVLTPDLIKNIKDYNSSEISNGGYLNTKYLNTNDSALKCKNYKKNNIIDKDYVVCTSRYLDTLPIERLNGDFIKYEKESEIKRKSGIGPAWK